MKTKLLIILGLAMIAAGAVLWLKPGQSSNRNSPDLISKASPVASANSHVHSPQASAKRVLAFYETPPSILPPTLAPDKFTGKTFAAYKAVSEIPKLLRSFRATAIATRPTATRVCIAVTRTSMQAVARCV